MDALQCLMRLNHLRAKLGQKPEGVEAQYAQSLDRAIASISRLVEGAEPVGDNVIALSQWRKPMNERVAHAQDPVEKISSFQRQA